MPTQNVIEDQLSELVRTMQRASSPASARRPGRKKRVGSIDTSTGHVMWCMGYCDFGHKALVSRQELDIVKVNIRKQLRSPIYRVLRRCLKHYER